MKTTTTCQGCGMAIPESPLNDPDYGPAFCVECRYHHVPPKVKAHSDSEEYVIALETTAATGLKPCVEISASSETTELQETHLARLAKWFDWLDRGDAQAVGARVKLIRHISGRGKSKTDAELARECGLSKGRISQLRRELKTLFPSLGGCNSRQR